MTGSTGSASSWGETGESIGGAARGRTWGAGGGRREVWLRIRSITGGSFRGEIEEPAGEVEQALNLEMELNVMCSQKEKKKKKKREDV